MSAIPGTWDEITPAWLEEILQPRFPGVRVASVRLLARTDGSNRRAKVSVTYAAGGAPEVLFLKAEGEHREVHARNGNLFNEPRLAAAGVPLGVDHPDPYAVVVDEPGLDWLVAMEDVTERGADPRDATRPMTPAQAVHGVRGLARLHRLHWGFTPSGPLDWVQTWSATEGFASGLRRRVPTGLERGAGELPAEVLAMDADEVVGLWCRYADLAGREPVTLLHADAHIGNTYVLPDDTVGFLDWQVARRGNWSQDVGHFFQGAVTEADRRATEKAMIAAYLDEVGHEVEDAWTWYRASAAYGLAIWLSTLGTDGYQSREISLALARRFSTAFVELDAVAAITELERG